MRRRAPRLVLLVALLVSLLGAAACHRRAPPNVVLISIDTLRADAVGAYGGPLATPAIDGLAAQGVALEWAFAPTPTTAPSHATLLTGQHVTTHGTGANGPIPLTSIPLEAAFRSAGYSTAAFVSSYVLSHKLGWNAGFAHFDDDFPAGQQGLQDMIARPAGITDFHGEPLDRVGVDTTRAVRSWLATAQRPFFVFVHYMDPHTPYHARRPYAPRVETLRPDVSDRHVPGYSQDGIIQAVLAYQAEVLYVDDAVAGLLQALDERGLRDDTLVVLTADHGEGLGQHGWMGHTVYLYDEQIRVPLLLRWPGELPAGKRLATPVGLVDVAPTIASLAGVTLPAPVDGRSLAEALRRGVEPDARPVFGVRPRFRERYRDHFGEKRYVRTDRWKLIRAEDGPAELYDLAADPRERVNRIASEPVVAAELGALLDANVPPGAASGKRPDLTDTERKALEALGYAQ